MGKERLAAFSDGVIAIIITIMVLELKMPHGADWSVLLAVMPNFLSYVLSFTYLAIYWNNHHHLLHTVAHVDGLISGPIPTCYSGYHSSPPQRLGWAKTFSLQYRPQSMGRVC
jgi:hypothetical protein